MGVSQNGEPLLVGIYRETKRKPHGQMKSDPLPIWAPHERYHLSASIPPKKNPSNILKKLPSSEKIQHQNHVFFSTKTASSAPKLKNRITASQPQMDAFVQKNCPPTPRSVDSRGPAPALLRDGPCLAPVAARRHRSSSSSSFFFFFFFFFLGVMWGALLFAFVLRVRLFFEGVPLFWWRRFSGKPSGSPLFFWLVK